jgi:hypothetical protein
VPHPSPLYKSATCGVIQCPGLLGLDGQPRNVHVDHFDIRNRSIEYLSQDVPKDPKCFDSFAAQARNRTRSRGTNRYRTGRKSENSRKEERSKQL